MFRRRCICKIKAWNVIHLISIIVHCIRFSQSFDVLLFIIIDFLANVIELAITDMIAFEETRRSVTFASSFNFKKAH